MKKILFLLATAGSILLYGACEKSETGSGTLNLSITDAPIDSAGVRGVYIAINRIEYHSAAEGWVDLDTFATPLSFNLLELTRGTAELLGSYELPTGTYSQIRFHLDHHSSGSQQSGRKHKRYCKWVRYGRQHCGVCLRSRYVHRGRSG